MNEDPFEAGRAVACLEEGLHAYVGALASFGYHFGWWFKIRGATCTAALDIIGPDGVALNGHALITIEPELCDPAKWWDGVQPALANSPTL